MKQFTIRPNEAGQRFDKYLKKLLSNASGSFVYKMLQKKNITLKKIPIRYLWDGMVLSDDLYNESGKVLLIRAGERITEKTIGQLKNLL